MCDDSVHRRMGKVHPVPVTPGMGGGRAHPVWEEGVEHVLSVRRIVGSWRWEGGVRSLD